MVYFFGMTRDKRLHRAFVNVPLNCFCLVAMFENCAHDVSGIVNILGTDFTLVNQWLARGRPGVSQIITVLDRRAFVHRFR